MFSCFVCRKKISEVKIYITHLKLFHKLSSHSSFFQCTICPQSFQNIYAFRRHLIRHSEKKNLAQNEVPFEHNKNQVFTDENVSSNSEPDLSIETNLSHVIFEFILKLYGNMSLNRKTVVEIIKNCEDIFMLFQNSIDTLTDASIIKNKFKIFKNQFSELNTEYKFLKMLKNKNLFTDPEEFLINSCVTVENINVKSSKGILLLIKDNIINFMQVNNNLTYMINKAKELENSSKISNIINGSVWKEKIKLFKNKLCIPYLLYQDDFELDNPLGSKAGVDKISAFYMSFPLLSDSEISKLHNILSCCYIKSSDSSYGNAANLMPLVTKLKELEESGINVPSKNGTVHVHLILAAITADNLGLNSILGFTKSFSANNFCRICTCNKSVTQKLVMEDCTKFRTIENYNEALLSKDIPTTGIKENCVFNIIKSFNVIDNVTCDMMHDILEGIAHYELCDILNYFIIEKKYFSLSVLNSRKYAFDYGPTDSKNKTVDVKIKHITNKRLRMSASEMKSFLHFLPFIIGDFVPINDKVWGLLRLLIRLVENASLPNFTIETLVEFRALIAEHHQLYLNIFDGHLMPKHHFITHYISAIKKLGPMKKLWTMRFEAKHKANKTYAGTTTSRKNILLSLAIKSNYHFAHTVYSKIQNEIDQNTICSSGNFINFTDNYAWPYIRDKTKDPHIFTNIFSVQEISINCTCYKVGNILPTLSSQNEISVFQIKYILIEKNNTKQLLVCQEFQNLQIDSHLDCYVVDLKNNSNTDVYEIIDVCDVNFPPLHLIMLPNKKTVIKLKIPFN